MLPTLEKPTDDIQLRTVERGNDGGFCFENSKADGGGACSYM